MVEACAVGRKLSGICSGLWRGVVILLRRCAAILFLVVIITAAFSGKVVGAFELLGTGVLCGISQALLSGSLPGLT